MIISRLILLRMKSVQIKIVEKMKNKFFFLVQYRVFKHRDVCEIMWADLVEPDRPQMTI